MKGLARRAGALAGAIQDRFDRRLTASFDDDYARMAMRRLRRKGLRIRPGLTDAEVERVEAAIGAPLPPDLAALLRAGLPTGPKFPDWRGDPEDAMRKGREWIALAFLFDIERNDWWFSRWGPRPANVDAAKRLCLERLAGGPPLVPIYAHRFIPTEPHAPRNPVLSIRQAEDSILYGYDLADYLSLEFGILLPLWAAEAPAPVPFWGELLQLPYGQQSYQVRAGGG